MELKELVKKICDQEYIKLEDIRKRSRVKRLSNIRKAIVLSSRKYCKINNKVISDMLKINPSMVSKIKNDAVIISKEVISIVKKYENK